MPGIISPRGTYCRSRSPRWSTAALSWSAMPYSICSSMADGGKSYFSSKARAWAMERTLCVPSASFTPPWAGRRAAHLLGVDDLVVPVGALDQTDRDLPARAAGPVGKLLRVGLALAQIGLEGQPGREGETLARAAEQI